MRLMMRLTVISLLAIASAFKAGSGQILKTSILKEPKSKNFLELCQELNQRCAEYEVVTEDGYILTLHRVIGNKEKPVICWHGILDSSDAFILRGLNSSSVALAAAGHDVWLGNSRGNKYSRRHRCLDPDKQKTLFWDFSFHEMGIYDMSAVINFVLTHTGQKKISIIGYSQATTMFYVLASQKPIYNELVQIFISMAPLAFMTNIKPLLRDLIPLWPAINLVFDLAGIYEILRDQSAANIVIQKLCSLAVLGNELCELGVFMAIVGDDREQIEPEFFRKILKHFPSGGSTKSITHYSQIFDRNKFANYDYGAVRNLEKYGAEDPPEYDLGKVSAPVALLCGANDRVSTLEDVALLRAALPNVARCHVMERPQFNHLDFIYARDINDYLNPLLLDLLCT